MQKFFKFFGGSTIFSVLALGLSFYIGYSFGGNSVSAGFAALFTAIILGILETSLSFDNAVINAKILGGMTPFWQRMFLTLGMLIAVFGMRIVFPLVIVWILSKQNLGEVLAMTWQNPLEFQRILVEQHAVIAGFGGAFLCMVFTRFFFDREKEEHWIPGLEKFMSRAGHMEALWVGVTMILTMVFFALIPDEHERNAFLMSSMLGIITYILIDGLGSLIEPKKQDEGVASPTSADGTVPGSSAAKVASTRGTSAASPANTAVKVVASGGLSAFMYLEVLDASFSFDGVIGAFAITNNLYIIALGLGIGAFFVRSLTIKLVADKTLGRYRYLEHGAFWAIGALSIIMFISASGVHVPELISGGVGLLFISLSIIASVRKNRREANLAGKKQAGGL